LERIVLDTSALIAVDRGKLPIHSILKANEKYYLPQVVIAEFLTGVELSRSNDERAAKLAILEVFETTAQVVNFDRRHAATYATVAFESRRSGIRRTEFDQAVAATALICDAKIRTSDRAARFEELPGITVSYF
jgi:tRNA(fMet)-specific endonuclease VapC